MPTNDELSQMVAAQQQAIDELRAEVAALRGERDARVAAPAISRRALFGLAGAGIVTAAVGSGATPAAAGTGDPLVLGGSNVAADTTSLTSTADITMEISSGMQGGDLPLRVDGGTKALWATAGAVDGIAVQGHSGGTFGFGVLGSGGLVGVLGQSDSGYGVGGGSTIGHAAALSTESGAHVLLERVPEGSLVGPPADRTVEAGYGVMSMDSTGDLHYGRGGSPAVWSRLNEQGPTFLPTAQRAFDSRTTQLPVGTAAGTKGKFGAREVRRIDLTAETGVPADARAAIVHLTVLSTELTGYLSVYPAGAPGSATPSFVHLQWFGPGQALGNTTFATLEGGGMDVHAANPTHVVVDVIGYYR